MKKILFFVFVMLFLLIHFKFVFVLFFEVLRSFLLTLIYFLLLPMHIGYLLKKGFIKIRLSFLVRQAISIKVVYCAVICSTGCSLHR